MNEKIIKYYKLRYDMDKYENNGIMLFCNTNEIKDRYIVKDGKLIDNWDKKIKFYFKSNNKDIITDYMDNIITWPIISEKCKNILCKFKIDGIQYLSVDIEDENHKCDLQNYYIMNIFNLIEAINLEKSNYVQYDIRDFKLFLFYTLDRKKIQEYDIFRPKEKKMDIVVSEKVKKIIEDNELTGFSFDEIKVF